MGRTALAFCTGRKDTVSNALNAISSHLDETMFGRLEVGTEIEESRKNPRMISEIAATNKATYETKCLPSTTLGSLCGNGYTASLYMAIASLIDSVEDLLGKRVLCFSYGSGAASTMFALRVEGDMTEMRKSLNLKERLDKRQKRTVEEYEEEMEREKVRYVSAPYDPVTGLDQLWQGQWYLEAIDDQWHRHYKIKVGSVQVGETFCGRTECAPMGTTAESC